MSSVVIPEIELAFSNACVSNCYICSKTHGGSNAAMMSQKVFDKAVNDLKEIQFLKIQTGGDGDSFLNPIFIESLRTLRKEFPKAKIAFYSNMYLFDFRRTEEIIRDNLIDELFTRVDSLDPRLFEACTGVSYQTCMDNIDFFIRYNTKIRYTINYASIPHYKQICQTVLNKKPLYWRPIMDNAKDEFEAVKKRFVIKSPGGVNKIKMSLWAERNDPGIQKEETMPCKRTHCFDSVCYIWTDGDVGICGYDDGQDKLIYGNIMESSIAELWRSGERQVAIELVLGRKIKGYPCINPNACLFY